MRHPAARGRARLLLALSSLGAITVAVLLVAAWWRIPALGRLRAGALVAAAPGWIGEATLSGPGFTLPLTVRWQRPGWWRVQSPAGDSAYDGRSLTVRLPGGAIHAVSASAAAQPAWQVLWPAPALRRPGPVDFDRRGWPVAWRYQGLAVRYTRITPAPVLPRADFSLTAAVNRATERGAGSPPTAPPLTPARLPFTPRPVPGLRPLWSAAYDLPGHGPVAVFAYVLDAGALTIAEQAGTCPAADTSWIRTEDGWIAHWCAGTLQFTAEGPNDRAGIARAIRALT